MRWAALMLVLAMGSLGMSQEIPMTVGVPYDQVVEQGVYTQGFRIGGGVRAMLGCSTGNCGPNGCGTQQGGMGVRAQVGLSTGGWRPMMNPAGQLMQPPMVRSQQPTVAPQPGRSQQELMDPRVVRVLEEMANGVQGLTTGSVIDNDGKNSWVLTVWHGTIERRPGGRMLVQTNEGRWFEAEIVTGDEVYDVALLKTVELGVRPLWLAEKNAAVGEMVTGGGWGEGTMRWSRGPVTGYLAPKMTTTLGEFDFVEYRGDSRDGDSGGPIANSAGQLCGMISGGQKGVSTNGCSVEWIRKICCAFLPRCRGGCGTNGTTVVQGNPNLPVPPGAIPGMPSGDYVTRSEFAERMKQIEAKLDAVAGQCDPKLGERVAALEKSQATLVRVVETQVQNDTRIESRVVAVEKGLESVMTLNERLAALEEKLKVPTGLKEVQFLGRDGSVSGRALVDKDGTVKLPPMNVVVVSPDGKESQLVNVVPIGGALPLQLFSHPK